MGHATVTVDKTLNIKLTSVGSNGSMEVKAQLSRVSAQQLADALLEYTGLAAKSFERGDQTRVPAFDRTERAKSLPKRVIRLGSSSKR